MTSVPSDPDQPSESITAPLVLWLALQLLALLVAAARIPLSALYPQPAESLAMEMMAIVQTFALAMLAPLLLRAVTSAIAIALTAGPMLQLAAVLEDAPFTRVILVWLNVALFAFALLLWRIALGAKRAMWLVAVGNFLTLGGAILFYLTCEFSPPASARAFAWSPTIAVVQLSSVGGNAVTWWAAVGAMLLSGAVATWVGRWSRAGET